MHHWRTDWTLRRRLMRRIKSFPHSELGQEDAGDAMVEMGRLTEGAGSEG